MATKRKFGQGRLHPAALVVLVCCLAWLTLPQVSLGGNDFARALALDASGNVIVTGSSDNGANDDFLTIKYDGDGNWFWGRRLNGPADYHDIARALAVLPSGNVIVTGYSENVANRDFLTINYDADGNWLWGRRLNGPANGDDSPNSIAVDASGNVIVTGESWNGTNSDYLTVKYAADGTWLWGRRLNGPANYYDYPVALAVDASGNVIVTGSSWNGANQDYLTVKYDPAGAWLWGQRLNGPANGNDSPAALAVDASGNVIVTGSSWNGTNFDYLTVKYAADGTWLWGRRLNGPADKLDYLTALAADANGNVIVTGYSSNGVNHDFLTIKYDANGNWLWGQRLNGPANGTDIPRALAVDASGNVIVTGESWNGTNSDYLTVKYDADGTWLWGQRLNGPANSEDFVRALGVYASGNVYVTGDSWNGTNYDYLTIKYDAGGSWLWGQRFDASP